MREYGDQSCNYCGHEFGMPDTIYPVTLWMWRWNVCRECRDPFKEQLEALFKQCLLKVQVA